MEPRQENLLTLATAALCLTLLVVAWAPQLVVRRAPAATPSSPEVTVSVAGAVRSPGTYVLPWGARAGDAVDAAGGLAREAATELLRPADPLSDGEAVVVPTVRSEAGDERVSINAASPERLEGLPGIGPALAERIVAARPFRRLSDLRSVSGIGPATLERLRPHVTL